MTPRSGPAGPTRRTVATALLAAPALLSAGAAGAATGAPPARRIVSLDYGLAQHLLVLGVPPVAVADARDWDRWVAEPALPPATVDIGTALAPNLELIAALRPDLVLSTDYTAPSEPPLRRIAAVDRFSIYGEGGSPLPKAMEALARQGALVGRPEAADAYRADTDRFFAAMAERARPFREKPVLLVAFVDARHVRVYARPGMQQDVLDRLGLVNAWTAEGTSWGFATVPVERLAEAGPAVAMADYLPPDVARTLERSPLFTALPIRAGRRPLPVLPTVAAFGGVPAARRWATLIVETLERTAA